MQDLILDTACKIEELLKCDLNWRWSYCEIICQVMVLNRKL